MSGHWSLTDPAQGWAWNGLLYSACRLKRHGPCSEKGLMIFFDDAATAAREAGIQIFGRNHYRRYHNSIKTVRLVESRRGWVTRRFPWGRKLLPAPQPEIAPHIRWYIDQVLQQTRGTSPGLSISEPFTPRRSYG